MILSEGLSEPELRGPEIWEFKALGGFVLQGSRRATQGFLKGFLENTEAGGSSSGISN